MSQQALFQQGLLDPAQPAPPETCDNQGRPAGRRYDVYRNNVTASLIDALKTAFPFVQKLIGTARFAQLAPDYVRAHPPTSPLMMHYGVDFAEFLAEQPALSRYGYLPDAARFDLALRRSYHAADAPPFDATILSASDPAEVMATRLSLAPATVILASPWPIFDIWRHTFEEGAAKPQPGAQDVLISRPAFDPQPTPLPPGGATWLRALNAGQTLAEAQETALAATADFDLAATLTCALNAQAFSTTPPKDLK